MAASVANLVDRVLKKFNSATAKPESFLSIQDVACENFRQLTKDLYDFLHKDGSASHTAGLPELLIEGFEEEQVWQQLELHNGPAHTGLLKVVAKVIARSPKITFRTTLPEAPEVVLEAVDDEEGDEDAGSVASDLSALEMPEDSDSDEGNGSDIDETGDLRFDEFKVLDEGFGKPDKRLSKAQPVKMHRKSVVDDQFFKLGEMEAFLQAEERPSTSKESQNDLIDYFDDVPSDPEEVDAVDAKYGDFFQPDEDAAAAVGGAVDEESADGEEEDSNEGSNDDGESDAEDGPSEKRVKFDLDDDSASDSPSSAAGRDQKSSFELRQDRLKSKIEELEDEALAPKSWQLLGESKADLRPENALLEEDLFFEHTTRQAPVITEETTRTLEDIIKQRIKDQAFDDVQRKVKPVIDPAEYKKKLVLDQEKSKFSLAEIYEQEYLQKQEQQQQEQPKSSSLADPVKDEEKQNAAHERITKMIRDLYSKLDALCNFHFTPRMPSAEIKIVSNMPSIAMEEVAPVAVSDGHLLAPQEVQDPVKGELKTSSEKQKTDQLRERRKKKLKQRARHKEQEQKEKAADQTDPGQATGKHAKKRALRQLEKAHKDGTVTLIQDNKDRALKSSTAFFNQLQQQVTTQVKSAKVKKGAERKDKRSTSAAQFKL